MLYTRADGRKLVHTVDGNRNQPLEPVVHIPIAEMKEVKENMINQIIFFLQKLNVKTKCNTC